MLNAGSSSLKFCVYQRPRGRQPGGWRRAARSKASAPSPRFSAKDGAGALLDDERSDAEVARRARGARRSWPPGCARVSAARECSASATASSTAARGTPARRSSRRRCSTELRTLVPLAPLHQPHNLAAIDAVSERLPGRAAGRLLRHQLSSRPAGGRRTRAAAARDPRAPACSATASTGCRTSTSRRCCRRWRRRSPTAASSSRTWAAAPACAR